MQPTSRPTPAPRSAWLWTALLLAALAAVTGFSPLERTLGASARLVYLHGAWVWAGMLTFAAASLTGAAALALRRPGLFAWSRALGLAAITFWLIYLPMSLLMMKLNWGGLFLDEPRWRVPLAFGVAGVLLQAGLTLFDRPAITAAANLVFGAALITSLSRLQSVLHPDSPIFNSPSRSIQAYFVALLSLALLLAWQAARLWLKAKPKSG